MTGQREQKIKRTDRGMREQSDYEFNMGEREPKRTDKPDSPIQTLGRGIVYLACFIGGALVMAGVLIAVLLLWMFAAGVG